MKKAVGLFHGLLSLCFHCYKVHLSAFMGHSCRFEPTCAHYIHAIYTGCPQRYSPSYALFLTLRRLCRCHPLGSFGFDPPPGGHL